MKPTPPHPLSARAGAKPPGFTLIEVMMAGAVGSLVLAAVASILVMSLRMVHKNQQIDAAVTNTRLVQEHINAEMAIAISQTSPVVIRPTFSNASTTTPVRYATMTYRVPIGSYGTVQSDTPNTSSSINVIFPPDVTPQAGDYFLMDSPNLGNGIRITDVSGSGTVSLSLATTILAGTDPSDTPINALASKLVRIQRERKYETVGPTPAGSPVTELHWYDSTHNATYITLSKNVDSNARYLFSQIPVDVSPSQPALEPSVSWQFSYVASGSDAHSQGGDTTFYQTNYAEGLIMPKSGNPLSASSILGGDSTSLASTTTTTTLGTSTTLVSSTTTTTKGTSTTKVSSTTVKSTTTSGTSTTALTSTTKQSTTTQKSSTTLVSSTTLKSTTTQKSSTTLVSSTTLKSTTTAGTSTTKQSTTTAGTSTTALTSSTKQSTTTSGTSTTAKSTSTAGTSTTALTSTTKRTTTTTIPFDG